MSVVCTRIYQPFVLNVLLAVLLTMSRCGQWHAPRHLVPPGLPSIAVHGLPLNWSVFNRGGRGRASPLSRLSQPQISSVVTAGETVLFWFLQDSEGAQPLNLSAKPKASESKSPNSPPTSPQVPAAAAGATKLGHSGSGKHSAPSSIGGPPTRMSSIGKWTCLWRFKVRVYSCSLRARGVVEFDAFKPHI